MMSVLIFFFVVVKLVTRCTTGGTDLKHLNDCYTLIIKITEFIVIQVFLYWSPSVEVSYRCISNLDPKYHITMYIKGHQKDYDDL